MIELQIQHNWRFLNKPKLDRMHDSRVYRVKCNFGCITKGGAIFIDRVAGAI